MTGRSGPKSGSPGATFVLLRAVNVGGHGTFRPKELAARMERFGVISVGAAGSFVARRPPPASQLTKALIEALGFETEIILLPAAEITDLLDRGPKEWQAPPDGTRRFLTFLATEPKKSPRLPIVEPPGTDWHLRVIDRQGPAVRTIRKVPASVPWTYPNPVIEKAFGVPATTRGWETLDELRRKAA